MRPVFILRLALFALACLTGLLAAVVTGVRITREPYQFHGTAFDPPQPAADFALTDQNRQTFRLSEQRGRWMLLYFGYTNCQDVCPATVGLARSVFEALGRQAAQARFILVTVDPVRDTPETLREFLAGFNPDFVGLTGNPAALASVAADYGVAVDPASFAFPAAGRDAGHGTWLFVVDPVGRLRVVYAYGVTAEEITLDLEYLMKADRFGAP